MEEAVKTVKHNGVVQRVNDDEAARVVKAGGKYVPKSEWKKETHTLCAWPSFPTTECAK